MEEKQLTIFDDVPVVELLNDRNEELAKQHERKNKIILSSRVERDEYTDYIEQTFDLHVGDVCEVLVPNNLDVDALNDDWHIGVICGASGSGKSTMLRHIASKLGKQCNLDEPTFDRDKTLIANFSMMTPKNATMLLSQIGLASVPTWIRPYHVLSNGEQYRARLAKKIAQSDENDIIFVDEYTSVVDRNVAMSMSNALQKYIRKTRKRIILASCHYDIFDWLRPDWIYDMNKGGALERGDYLRRQRPQIELCVYRTTTDTWQSFKKHHYMTAALNESAMCFVFTWNNKLVAFESVLPLPNGSFHDAWREHRLVVLPDFQGLGLGHKISEWMGGVLKHDNKTFYCKTVNPALGLYRSRNKTNWEPTGSNRKYKSPKTIEGNMMGGLTRPSYCHKYVGDEISGYETLLLPADVMKYRKSNENQLSISFLFD